jgi:hypothetical protein
MQASMMTVTTVGVTTEVPAKSIAYLVDEPILVRKRAYKVPFFADFDFTWLGDQPVERDVVLIRISVDVLLALWLAEGSDGAYQTVGIWSLKLREGISTGDIWELSRRKGSPLSCSNAYFSGGVRMYIKSNYLQSEIVTAVRRLHIAFSGGRELNARHSTLDRNRL